jgi:hypothetical protein
MGRLALMMVMGLTLTLAVVGYQINQTNSRAIEHVVSFQKYTMARNIAHTGINMALRKIDKQDSTAETRSFDSSLNVGTKLWITNNFALGSCSTMVWVPAPTTNPDSLLITSNSRYIDTTYTMRLILKKAPDPFPGVNAAVGLRVNNAVWSISGNTATIDGRDHDINGNLLPSSSNDRPAVAVYYGPDTTDVLSDPPHDFEGVPKKVVQDSSIPNPLDYAQLYINSASYTYTGPATIASNQVWGLQSAPVVVYANASAGGIKFSGTCEGWGILICKGDLTMSGTFKWHGLVIAYNEITIQTDAALSTGNPDIIGAFLLAGAPGSSFGMKGNCLAVYSSAALKNAMLIGTLQSYKVIKWYE